jgi:hypothetical protein
MGEEANLRIATTPAIIIFLFLKNLHPVKTIRTTAHTVSYK